MGVKGLNKKNVFYPFTLSCCSNVGSMSVSEKLSTCPSPNTTLTLTCKKLIVVGLGGGVGMQMLTLIPNVHSVSTEFFSFFTIYNFSVWTVLRGLQGKN